jgi:hypothetical protein
LDFELAISPLLLDLAGKGVSAGVAGGIGRRIGFQFQAFSQDISREYSTKYLDDFYFRLQMAMEPVLVAAICTPTCLNANYNAWDLSCGGTTGEQV